MRLFCCQLNISTCFIYYFFLISWQDPIEPDEGDPGGFDSGLDWHMSVLALIWEDICTWVMFYADNCVIMVNRIRCRCLVVHWQLNGDARMLAGETVCFQFFGFLLNDNKIFGALGEWGRQWEPKLLQFWMCECFFNWSYLNKRLFKNDFVVPAWMTLLSQHRYFLWCY